MTDRMTDSEIMPLKKALFILRHGSAEGEHKYFEAIEIIENEINRQQAEIERLKKTRTGDILVFRGVLSSGKSKFTTQKIISVRNATVEEFVERIVSKAKSTKERFLLESLAESVMKEMGVEEQCKEND